MLADGSVAAKEFQRWQQAVRKAVDRAREEWITKLAMQGKQLQRIGRPGGNALGGYSKHTLDANPSCQAQ